MAKIIKVKAREILDSRGSPTIEVFCELEGGVSSKASVPSGASTGVHEAVELRDLDKDRYRGLGVLNAVGGVNILINEKIQNKDFDQTSLDELLIELDGTQNKSKLGANAMLGVSLSFARACSSREKKELYVYLGDITGNDNFVIPNPMLNVINGGKHSDSGLDLQEFMLIPLGFDSFQRKIQAGSETIASLKELLKSKNYSTSVGDEGGFAPKLESNEEAFDLLEAAIEKAGYNFDQIKIGIDAAASTFYKNGTYNLKTSGVLKNMNSDEMIDWYENLANKHPLVSIEDGLHEDDWEGFAKMTERIGDKVRIVGDDLTVTNVERINSAIQKKAINSVLIKLNQIGTLSETIKAVQLTEKQGWVPIISHRSGETDDTFIADLSVGLSCPYIKSGSLARSERVSKYNRLMEIEQIEQ